MEKRLMSDKHDSLFIRYEHNPIIKAEDMPYHTNAVFNPGAVSFDNKFLLLLRVEDKRGFSHLTKAISKDGKKNWHIPKKPTIYPSKKNKEEQWGCEDSRIVYLNNIKQYAITYVSFSKSGPLVSLALTKDFKHFKRLGPLLPPEDKDASLFPRLIKGRYVLIHRPIIRGEANIWISFSPDLKHWGDHKMIIPSRDGWWDCHRVGLGPPPIRTKYGWLIIYHGVRHTASGALYRVGLALLDLNNPTKLLKRTDTWIFGPNENYERIGDVPGVTFPTGTIYNKPTNELYIYYGAADSSVCLAFANIDKILNYLWECPNG